MLGWVMESPSYLAAHRIAEEPTGLTSVKGVQHKKALYKHQLTLTSTTPPPLPPSPSECRVEDYTAGGLTSNFVKQM
jgi:hypothetical protein